MIFILSFLTLLTHFLIYQYYIQKNESYNYSFKLFLVSSISLFILSYYFLLLTFKISLPSILMLLVFSIMIHVFFIDSKNHLIPNKFNFVLFVLALIIVVSSNVDFYASLTSGVYYFIVFFVFYLLAKGNFGMGDVKLSLPIGIILGVSNIGQFIVTVLFTGSFIALFLLIFKIKKANDKIAFGPFMIVAFFYLFLT